MVTLTIAGGKPLVGSVRVAGGNNTALAIIAGAALAADVSVIENIPHTRDVRTLLEILEALGARTDLREGRLGIDTRAMDAHVAPYDLCRRMRASFYLAGVLLGRRRTADVPLPGGDLIGDRPVDFHLRGFQALGASAIIEHGRVKASAAALLGTEFFVPRQSVGTTINMMFVGSLAEGTTVLQNAAREPEVVDTAVFLDLMGARIRGAGTPTITIEGVRELHGAAYTVIPDRIEAGTYLVAGAATGGDVVVADMIPEHLTSVLAKLQEAGAEVLSDGDAVRVHAPAPLRAADVDTAPYPGFATDLHPPFAAAMTAAEGVCQIRETIFEGRFVYLEELRRLGADVRSENDVAVIRGVPFLTGAPIQALDIRGGAALVIGGLVAQGETVISGVEHIERKYQGLEENLLALGARVERVATGDDVPVA